MLVLWLIYMALRYLMGLVSVVINLFTLGCVITKSYLRSSSSLIIASIAVSDFLHGFLIVVMLPVTFLTWATGMHAAICLTSSCIEATGIFTQFTSFTMLAFERRNSLLFRLGRSDRWSREAVVTVLILMWLIIILYNVTTTIIASHAMDGPLVGCSFVNIYPAYFNYIAIGIYIGTTILTMVGYGHIGMIARKSSNQVQPAMEQSNWRKDLKFTKMMALVVGIFFMLYLPFVINTASLTPASPAWHQILYQISILIFDINFWINPFIYARRDKAFKKAFSETLAACCCRCCCCLPLQTGPGPVVQVAAVPVSLAVDSRQVATNVNPLLVPRDPLTNVNI